MPSESKFRSTRSTERHEAYKREYDAVGESLGGKSVSSRMVGAAKAARSAPPANRVTNFMGGGSYELDPLETLKMVTASSIFGEPQYYRAGEFAEATIVQDGRFSVDDLFRSYLMLDASYIGKKTSEIMEDVIDKALDYDFAAVLDWAVTLRKEFYMRLNPQIIMVRAAMHPKRAEFTAGHPGAFAKINDEVMSRADEPASQLTYYLYRNGSKNSMPMLLKRSWAKRIERMSAYDIYKYRNKGVGLIDTVRICHANNPLIDELMKTGTVSVSEDEKTWETLRASGKSWREILDTVHMGHMALLRNLRGIFTEINDAALCSKVLDQLKRGVIGGKQFPFRYQSAINAIDVDGVHHRPQIMTALEECMDIACANMPRLKGKSMCLSDNSGSAWGTFNSEYGSVTVANIGNLSSVITARNSDEGYVGVFGDRLTDIPINQRGGILSQAKDVDAKGKNVGAATENGVWLFFKKALAEKEHWDNIFIYSDMQAGHGGLYGIDGSEYPEFKCAKGYWPYIDVAKLIDAYRRKVNPKVNVYCIQTAGYDNVLVPENGYRTTVLYGWTGRELVYADAMNRFWDEVDISREKNSAE